jgi:hypothetical protein
MTDCSSISDRFIFEEIGRPARSVKPIWKYPNFMLGYIGNYHVGVTYAGIPNTKSYYLPVKPYWLDQKIMSVR